MPLVDDNDSVRAILASARTIAVVGLSDKPWRDSHTVTAYMLQQGYVIIPVNPRVRSVFGIAAVAALGDLTVKPDIVNVFRRNEHVPEAVDGAIGAGARTVWLQTGVVHEDAAARAALAGLNVVMDRCIRVAHTLLLR